MRSDAAPILPDFEVGDPLGFWICPPPQWSKTKLWDLAEYINGRAFKPRDFATVGLQVIKITELKYGVSEDTTHYEGRYEEKHLLRKNDLLFAWSGNPETSLDAFWWRDGEALLNQHIFRVIPRQGLDKAYLFYLLKFLRPTFIRTARDKATSMGHVKVSDLKRLIAFVPPPIEQRAIASILGALDDKIELNRRMNETLEAMARTIFKSWFVDFDPVRVKAEGRQPVGMDTKTAAKFPDAFQESICGKIPKGWRVGKLDEVIEILGGGTPKTSIASYWDGDIPWFSVVDAPWSSDVFVIQTEKKITQAGVENSSTIVLPIETTIISARGTVGRLAVTGIPMAMNQSCYGIRGKNEIGNYFTYFNLRDKVEDLTQSTHGTVFDTITRDTFKIIDTVIPPPDLTREFDQTVRPFLDRLRKNLFESQTLAQLRDTSLPKLISGEIRVKDAQKLAEKTA